VIWYVTKFRILDTPNFDYKSYKNYTHGELVKQLGAKIDFLDPKPFRNTELLGIERLLVVVM
jgi:hypothetical protein